MGKLTSLLKECCVKISDFHHCFRYGCDLAYTPMIVSESFIQSSKARDVEFTTNDGTSEKILFVT